MGGRQTRGSILFIGTVLKSIRHHFTQSFYTTAKPTAGTTFSYDRKGKENANKY